MYYALAPDQVLLTSKRILQYLNEVFDIDESTYLALNPRLD